ncbi:hypothetical protein L3X38_031517 [Prunus dulcis]|uniref:Uncharacterized protein n=1 Tax=Prunus dulcis TaxID=3755 RepID=A0AAD4VCC3_PRUDU|nr:hypothetical protein L3X38_031517 [Prunus dulcis]
MSIALGFKKHLITFKYGHHFCIQGPQSFNIFTPSCIKQNHVVTEAHRSNQTALSGTGRTILLRKSTACRSTDLPDLDRSLAALTAHFSTRALNSSTFVGPWLMPCCRSSNMAFIYN